MNFSLALCDLGSPSSIGSSNILFNIKKDTHTKETKYEEGGHVTVVVVYIGGFFRSNPFFEGDFLDAILEVVL